MTLTTPKMQAQIVVAGVDTHADTHDVTVLGIDGRWLGHDTFEATTAGYEQLVEWVAGFGLIDTVGVELTGSYGAGLTRHLTAAGVTVIDVNTPHPFTTARKGKDDRIDSEQAARKVLSGEATTTPKDTTGPVEALRNLKVARDSAVKSRTIALQNIRDLLLTAPARLRESVTGMTLPAKAKHFASCRPDRTRLGCPEQAAKTALRALGRRVQQLSSEIADADQDMKTLTGQIAPNLLAVDAVGPQHAAQLLITAGNAAGGTAGGTAGRIRSEAAFARLCGVAPVPIASGKTHRMRLHRGGDRQANKTLYMMAVNRLGRDPGTQAYVARRTAEGLSKQDIIRCLKRYIAREVFIAVQADLNRLDNL